MVSSWLSCRNFPYGIFLGVHHTERPEKRTTVVLSVCAWLYAYVSMPFERFRSLKEIGMLLPYNLNERYRTLSGFAGFT